MNVLINLQLINIKFSFITIHYNGMRDLSKLILNLKIFHKNIFKILFTWVGNRNYNEYRY